MCFFSFTFDRDSFSINVQLGAASLTAQVEADGRLVVDVESDIAPVGERYDLGPRASLTTTLPAGVTPIALQGVLPATTHGPQAALSPGAHQIELLVMDAATLALLALVAGVAAACSRQQMQ